MAKTKTRRDHLQDKELVLGKTVISATGAEINALDAAAFGATIVVGAEVPNVINVTVQLEDANGVNLAIPVAVPFYLADDAAGLDPSTAGPSVGTTIGTDGAIVPMVADLSGILVSEADGAIDIDLEDAATPTFYLVIVLANGKLIVSDAITWA